MCARACVHVHVCVCARHRRDRWEKERGRGGGEEGRDGVEHTSLGSSFLCGYSPVYPSCASRCGMHATLAVSMATEVASPEWSSVAASLSMKGEAVEESAWSLHCSQNTCGVCVCVCACVRACVRVHLYLYMRACACACARIGAPQPY